MALPILPLAVLALGIGAVVYYNREASASSSEETSGTPYNWVTAANAAEYDQVKDRLNLTAKPVVLIKFKPGKVPFGAIQSSSMAAARAYPQIWVVVLTEEAALSAGGEGVGTQCGPDDGGVVLAAPYGGGADSEVYVGCWPVGADPDLVKQNINIAAVHAKNLAAQTPNA